jgi:acetyltransferase-like isoleucine patch superfamily enzyme
MYQIAKLIYVLSGRKMKILISYFRRKGVVIGDGCMIYSCIETPEPYLIFIGDNVTIAGDVKFVTHDNSISKILPQYSVTVGRIEIGNNVFVGAKSLIMPGVSIGSNSIIAAGSIVTKSFGEDLIIAGNPAKIIGDINSYKEKIAFYGLYTDGIGYNKKKELILLNCDKWINK